MKDTSPIPEITVDDVEWVTNILRLDAVDEMRRRFLMCRTTLDVSACPGSGKTTLLVAKLAILARKWPHRSRGVCVISHTNVARDEIEKRLGNTVVGQTLLSYPHFIGTIHGFVNHFLALPWLHSKGFPVAVIDDTATTAFRRRLLGKDYFFIKNALEPKHLSFEKLRICKRDFTFDFSGTPFPFGSNARSFGLADKAVRASAQAGYFCHDEMFVWGQALLQDYPKVSEWLAQRFPLVLIDEMQDTSGRQASILDTVFPRQQTGVIVQRVGDPNQAIYNDSQGESGEEDSAASETVDAAENDAAQPTSFPDLDLHLEIPSSFRFGQEIARLASPLAVTRVQPDGLVGLGPKVSSPIEAPNGTVIFIFPDDSTQGVLDAFGHHVLNTVPDSLLSAGPVTAIGAVHRRLPETKPGEKAYPRSVVQYWSKYTPEVAARDPVPSTLAGYFQAAQAIAMDNQDLAKAVDKVASGIIRYSDQIGDIAGLRQTLKPHRSLLTALEGKLEGMKLYRQLLQSLLINRDELTKARWAQYKADLVGVALSVCQGESDPGRGAEFLLWSGDNIPSPLPTGAKSGSSVPNLHRVSLDGRYVDIRLGSIHSVKGQTHLATLVLDTYNRTHFFGKLLPWFIGKKASGNGEPADEKRMRQAYVAMTRPTHVLCLAVRHSSVGKGRDYERNITKLKQAGWRVAELIEGSPVWV